MAAISKAASASQLPHCPEAGLGSRSAGAQDSVLQHITHDDETVLYPAKLAPTWVLLRLSL